MTVIGLHQTAEFNKPALSFFYQDSPARISQLRKADFPFVADLDPTNAVMKSPAGQMIFVFNLP